MRAVLDTNIFVSATLIKDGNEDRILRAWQRGEFELILSQEILKEIGRALLYQKLRKFRWMTEKEITVLLQLLAEESVLVSGKVAARTSRDPDDDKFLAAAVEGGAKYVVTGDKDLLDLKHYRGVAIIRSAAFLKIV
jgi:uncharacterized protein